MEAKEAFEILKRYGVIGCWSYCDSDRCRDVAEALRMAEKAGESTEEGK